MAKYVFPAIFTPEDGGYSILFPDIENCFTEGFDLTDAMENAKDVLCLMIYDLERSNQPVPAASRLTALQQHIIGDQFITFIACDTMEYRKFHDNRAVKKTLSIPSWLNEMAESAGVNFSATLQEALKQQLNIQ